MADARPGRQRRRAPAQFDLPPDQRFYGGGSSTVRGFKYQSVGPAYSPMTIPKAAPPIDAATLEFRQRVWGNIGAAVFLDAAQVNSSSAPFQGTLREGVGVGVALLHADRADPRRYRGAGERAAPWRFSFELYLGLGTGILMRRRHGKIALWVLGIVILLPVALVLLVVIAANTGARPAPDRKSGSQLLSPAAWCKITGLGGRFPDALRLAQPAR